MKPFQSASISKAELDRVRSAYLHHSDAFWNSVLGTSHLPEDRRRYLDTLLDAIANEPFFRNDRYQVFMRSIPAGRWPALTHLSICRIDRKPIHDWRELQEIKNALVGPEHEAVELYPAESRLVDTANQFHLWA